MLRLIVTSSCIEICPCQAYLTFESCLIVTSSCIEICPCQAYLTFESCLIVTSSCIEITIAALQMQV